MNRLVTAINVISFDLMVNEDECCLTSSSNGILLCSPALSLSLSPSVNIGNIVCDVSCVCFLCGSGYSMLIIVSNPLLHQVVSLWAMSHRFSMISVSLPLAPSITSEFSIRYATAESIVFLHLNSWTCIVSVLEEHSALLLIQLAINFDAAPSLAPLLFCFHLAIF